MIQERLVLCARCAVTTALAAPFVIVCWLACTADVRAQVAAVETKEAAAPVTAPQPAAATDAAAANQPPMAQPMPMGETPPGSSNPMGSSPSTPNTPTTTTTRSTTPPIKADPDEFKIQPDADGKIQFSFNGQPWPDVLEWFARISGRTLDWQELPADYLNLTLHEPYTLDESRDLLNRHLLARGFTFLEHAEGFSIVKIEKLNPALVPRVSIAELDKRMPHEFVKVSFKLKWLMADELVKELESLKSPHGKLIALSQTNRIEAMDTVLNLREINFVLGEEQSDEGRNELVREFPLQHIKAVDVQKQLEKFLGIESPAAGAAMVGMNPEQMAMMQQQAQMAAQQAQMAAQQGGAAAPAQRKAEMRLVADPLRNRIIAHGPPDKIALIESFIRVADVPSGGAQSLEAMLSRVRVYRLASLDPDQFVQSLNELGGLDPMTRVRPDPKNNAIIVDGSLVDHYTINSLIEKLDGSGRRFEVIPLRRHSAEEVAGSIELLMGGNEEEESSSSRRGYYGFDYFGYGYGNNRDDQRKKDKFRVGANVEFNQLLLWANDIELEEVRKLLVKLGEISDPASGGRVRTIEVPRGQSPADVLEKLKQIWPSISPNPLELPPATEEAPDSEAPAEEESEDAPLHDANYELPKMRRVPTASLITQTFIATLLQDENGLAVTTDRAADQVEQPLLQADAEETTAPAPATSQNAAADTLKGDATGTDPTENPSPRERRLEEALRLDRQAREEEESVTPKQPPPVKVTIGPDGDIVISSQDTEALNLLQQVLEDSLPPPRDYHVFHLKYAPALWVKFNLEDFFKEDKDNEEDDYYRRWWYGMDSESSDNRRQLGKSKKMKFIDDTDTNTIVVVGADDEQLRIIADLIELYDVPEQVNSQNTRVTKLFAVKYSRASAIAATLKDTFIDLLSSNDRALQNQGQQNERPTATVIRNYGPPAPGGDAQQEKRTQITFKGKLAIGVDEITNTLIVSAEGESLLNIVGEIIEQLDRAAMPEAHVEVVPLAGNANYDRLQKALATMLAAPPAPQPNGQGQPANGQGQAPNQPAQQAPQPQPQPIIVE